MTKKSPPEFRHPNAAQDKAERQGRYGQSVTEYGRQRGADYVTPGGEGQAAVAILLAQGALTDPPIPFDDASATHVRDAGATPSSVPDPSESVPKTNLRPSHKDPSESWGPDAGSSEPPRYKSKLSP